MWLRMRSSLFFLTATSLMRLMSNTSDMFKQIYDQQGFVVIPSLLDDALDDLRAASERIVDQTRAGLWPHRRTVGRQFPPYGDDHPDSWGVQHVMHPDLGESAFAKWYTSGVLIGAIQTLLDCKEDELQMELFNMLINPTAHDFALRWHRDDVRESASKEEERSSLALWHHGIQWNTALYEDSCLFVVPGSHRLPRTPQQRELSSSMEPPDDPMNMPGAYQVTLRVGETVFYNSNILHCAVYRSLKKRATLHACMGSTRGGSARARNILQHDLDWMTEPRFRDGLSDRGKAMLDRLIAMKQNSGEVGYSLDN